MGMQGAIQSAKRPTLPPASRPLLAEDAHLPESLQGVSIVIPAYNEELGIESSVTDLLQVLSSLPPELQVEVIVVDDGSTDATADLAAQVADHRVRVVKKTTNAGYGAAIKSGMHRARFNWIAITDADGTYPAKHLVRLLALRDGVDMVVGARTTKQAQVPLVRRPAKWVLRKLAQFLIQQPIPDLNSGQRVMRRAVLEQYERLLPNQFSLTTTITLVMFSAGYNVVYEPVTYLKRKGRSKIRPLRDATNFLTLIIRTVMFFHPLRVFIPLSLLFVLAGVGVGVLSFASGRLMDVTTVVLAVTAVHLLAIGMLADLVNRRLG